VVLLATAAACHGADFDFATTIRAGALNSGQWEIGIGPINPTPTIQASLQPYHPNNQPRQFQLGYTSSTNTSYLRYYHAPDSFQQVTFSPGGAGLGAGSIWAIPIGSLSVEATRRPRPTSITVSQLSLGGGVQVLQPFSTTTLTATPNLSPASMGNTIVFRTGSTGNWQMNGFVSFAGLSLYSSGGANQTDLQFRAEIYGTSAPVPEPSTSWLSAAGLIMTVLWTRRNRSEGGAV
jgi:hypothetical protein